MSFEVQGVSRNAVYWHFKDQGDLFDAVMEQVTLAMRSRL